MAARRWRPSDVSALLSAAMCDQNPTGILTTPIQTRHPSTQNQQINDLLLRFDSLANLIHIFNEADVRFDEVKLALWIQRSACRDIAVCGFLRTADDIDAGLDGVFCELEEGCFADAACGADEEGDEFRRKSRGDERV